MIITTQKPLDEILDFLSTYERILVVGCDGCTQPPRSLKEAETLAQLIELGGKQRNKNFKTRAITLTKQCDSSAALSEITPRIGDTQAIVNLACGIGVQEIADIFPGIPVFPGQNTMFIGAEEKGNGLYEERCSVCGQCVLAETGGICPVTRCAKGLLNGPCGGTRKGGKCEIDPEKDCAWTLIYRRLEKQGKLDLMAKYHAPKNYRVVKRPGRLGAAKI
jgi:hypothetical protein